MDQEDHEEKGRKHLQVTRIREVIEVAAVVETHKEERDANSRRDEEMVVPKGSITETFAQSVKLATMNLSVIFFTPAIYKVWKSLRTEMGNNYAFGSIPWVIALKIVATKMDTVNLTATRPVPSKHLWRLQGHLKILSEVVVELLGTVLTASATIQTKKILVQTTTHQMKKEIQVWDHSR